MARFVKRDLWSQTQILAPSKFPVLSRRWPLLLLLASLCAHLMTRPARASQNDASAGQLPAEIRGTKVCPLDRPEEGLILVDRRPFLGKNRASWGYIHLEART